MNGNCSKKNTCKKKYIFQPPKNMASSNQLLSTTATARPRLQDWADHVPRWMVLWGEAFWRLPGRSHLPRSPPLRVLQVSKQQYRLWSDSQGCRPLMSLTSNKRYISLIVLHFVIFCDVCLLWSHPVIGVVEGGGFALFSLPGCRTQHVQAAHIDIGHSFALCPTTRQLIISELWHVTPTVYCLYCVRQHKSRPKYKTKQASKKSCSSSGITGSMKYNKSKVLLTFY